MARMPRGLPYVAQLTLGIQTLCGRVFDELDERAHGNTFWTPSRLLVTGALLSWDDGQTLSARFHTARELLPATSADESVATSYSGFARALVRSIPDIVNAVRPEWWSHMRRLAGDNWTTRGFVLFGVDGSRFESPRTAANQEGLKRAGKSGTAPQVFHTTLMHLTTGLIRDFRCGPGTDSERRHLEGMLPGLPGNSLIVADAGFSGYELLCRLLAAKVNFLFRVGSNVTLFCAEQGFDMERNGDVVWLWPETKRSSPPLELRLIRLERNGKAMYLLTNLDARRLPKSWAGEVYKLRWGVEVLYRSVKQTLNRAKWLSRTPKTVLAEHQVTILGVWLLQLLSAGALRDQGVAISRWSPALARDCTREVMRKALSHLPDGAQPPDWQEQLGGAVKDSYLRTGPKASRDWPRKKNDSPPGPPRLQKLPNPWRDKALSLFGKPPGKS